MGIISSSEGSVLSLLEDETYIFQTLRAAYVRLSQEYNGSTSGGRLNGDGRTCCFQGDLEWSWVDFEGSILGGTVAGMFAGNVTLPILGTVPGWFAGALAGGATYTSIQMYRWVCSSPSESGGGGDTGASTRGAGDFCTSFRECSGSLANTK